jgi:very-short-patch-repair endonuclease
MGECADLVAAVDGAGAGTANSGNLPRVPNRRRPSRLTGPATAAMASAAGISPKQLRGRDVVRLSRDTYLPRALSRDLRIRATAVLLNAPARAVISHRTAAELWGIEIPLQQPDNRIHLTVATGSAVRGRLDRCVHRVPFDDGDVVQRDGFPVTTPARTWRDLAMVLEPAALLAVTDQLIVERCTTSELRAELDRRPTGRGAARAKAVLPLADARAESPMESVLRWLLHAAGLPAPVLQFTVRAPGGRFLGRADLAWVEEKVLVEFDGDVHRERTVFVDDLRRQNRLVIEGWVILRFSSADVLGRPDEVIAEIRRALRQARSAQSPISGR